MKTLLCLLLVVVAPLVPLGAQSKVDSLRVRLVQTNDPNARMQVVAEIGKTLFFGSQYDSLGKYGGMLRELAKKNSSREMEVLATVLEAQGFARKDSATYFQKAELALKECESHKYDLGIGINCLGTGSRLLTLGKYEAATTRLMHGYQALAKNSSLEALGLRSDLIRTVSAVFHHQGKYVEALDYGLQSSRLADQSKVPMQQLKSYLNLSGLYGELSSPENNLGTADDRKRYVVEARKYMKLSYETSARVGSRMTRGATAYNLGSLYMEGGTFDSASLYLNEAIRLGKELNFHELLSNAYRTKVKLPGMKYDSSLYLFDAAYREAELAKNPISAVATSMDKAQFYFAHNDLKGAEETAKSTLNQALEHGLLNDQRSANLLLYQVKEMQGDFRSALAYHKSYLVVKDSMASERNIAKIEELKTKYESELKDEEIKNLEQQAVLQTLELRQKSQLVAGTIVAALLLASILFLFFRQRAMRQQQKALDLENRFLRFQLDPHFLSNALVSIQQYMLENNSDEAARYLSKFARLMRQLLEYSREELITIGEELDLLRNYLDIQKMRLKDRFTYSIAVDPSLSLSDSRIQPMFAQPFVENAIEHGIAETGGGEIRVVFRQQGNQLILEVIDNGAGIQTAKKSGDHRSLSTTIINERIALLNRSNSRAIQLAVSSASPAGGTRVQITLPIYS